MDNLDFISDFYLEELLIEKEKINNRFYKSNTLYDGSRLEIRESITGCCNFRCQYCTEGTSRKYDRNYMFWLKVNTALAAFGIKGIHHTGGEPTVRKNLDKYIGMLKKIGYESQVITTNGSNPELLSRCIENGATRFNISLDTLERKKFSDIIRVPGLSIETVMDSIEIARKNFDLYKINMVVMKKNFDEIDDMFHFAQEKGAVLRFIELYPYGPSIEAGKLCYEENHVSRDSIIEKLRTYGELSPVEVDGINAVPKYYNIAGYEQPIAIISPNWIVGGATCGQERCVRLRSGANGNITYCNNVPELSGDTIERMSMMEVGEAMSKLIYKKNERVKLKKYPSCHPFAYKTLRFGEIEK